MMHALGCFCRVNHTVSCLRVVVCLGRFMDQGKFVPDKIIFEVLVAAVERAKGEGKHILLDGFPRWGALS